MKICLIHTGGTIGMTKTDRGYATKRGYLSEALSNVLPHGNGELPQYDLIELPVILDSSDVSLDQWNEIGGIIADNYDKYSGFVVLHGTDTMCYTASALSFMFDGLGKPVVLTGSQIPLCEQRSDARDNLISAMLIASAGVVNEVCLCFGGCLLRGNRATKLSADRLTAFDSPNYPPLAEIGINVKYNVAALLPKSQKPFSFTPFKSFPIAVLKVFPGIQFDLFENILKPSVKGIVLEAFGAGNVPSGGGLDRLLKRANSNGTAIVIVTQCLQGRARLGLYEASSTLTELGAICGYDMTPESAVCKLYYLLSKGQKDESLRKLIESDLRGEITDK